MKERRVNLPIYNYSCVCGWKGDRTIYPREGEGVRDAQLCQARPRTPEVLELEARLLKIQERLRNGRGLGAEALASFATEEAEVGARLEAFECKAPLVRDEIALTSRQSHAWQP